MLSDTLLTRFLQLPGARTAWKKFPLGSLERRIRYGVFERAHYSYGVFAGAGLAKQLGLSAITVIEFGVAGGNGLVSLERTAAAVSDYLGIQISVCGFDMGSGMPEPIDYRDLPHVWGQGFYKMDVDKLKSRLQPSTELVLGNIQTTLAQWKPKSPVAFVSFDLDYYSSTKDALALFERPAEDLLPRVYSYFDDIIWPERACHCDRIGELLAIREFNDEHPEKSLAPIHMFRYMRSHDSAWNEQMYVMHDFKHPMYCRNITPSGTEHRELPLQQ